MKELKIYMYSALCVCLLLSIEIAADTLTTVKERGALKCGVTGGLAGFSNPDEHGKWEGLDVDFCRAVATAIFNDPTKVIFVPTTSSTRFTTLQTGEIDVLSRVTTWNLTRDTKVGLNFTGVTMYDGQGFMVRKDAGITTASELNGASICMNTGTSTEANIADFFKAKKMQYKTVLFEKSSHVVVAYDTGRCDVYTSDKSALAAQRLKMKKPDDHIILQETISKEPLGPAVRHGDDKWFDIVKWTLNALVEAEELGLNQKNIASQSGKQNPRMARFLGVSGESGKNLGLDNEWAKNIIRAVGNYGEIYERHVGNNGGLHVPRGLNKLWVDGGLMYAIPLN